MKALFFALAFLPNVFFAQENTWHEELGSVDWLRDYTLALETAEKEHKDVLILFQEVPGCATCRNYGHDVLSSPLVVEAVETCFVPLAVFNNLGGKDSEVLKKYEEPSWNNPVVRIVDHNGNMVVDRISEDYSALALCTKMIEAIEKIGKSVPPYLRLLKLELSTHAANRETAYFKVPCFWSGEKVFGENKGVLRTSSGFSEGFEVVEVMYNTELVSRSEIEKIGSRDGYELMNIEEQDFVKSHEDQHYYLQNSKYKFLALTEVQKTRINSALGHGQSPLKFLSQTQLKYFNTIDDEYPVLFRLDFKLAWQKMEKISR